MLAFGDDALTSGWFPEWTDSSWFPSDFPIAAPSIGIGEQRARALAAACEAQRTPPY